MITVPAQYKVKHPSRYPEDNEVEFERWFGENWTEEDRRSREYLPIYWTGYFVRHRYGRDHSAKQSLQRFINSLNRNKQYYSILQYDSGPLIKLPGNIKLFAMSGPVIHYPIPLICQPHRYEPEGFRDIFANFLGGLTHPIRKRLLSYYSNKSGYMVTNHKRSMAEFCGILSRSVFTLCPRGFGESSFRIQEALQYGSIPVYISDKFIFPGNIDFNEYGVVVNHNDVMRLHDILSSFTDQEIKQKQERGRVVYQEIFTYEGCKKLILNNL